MNDPLIKSLLHIAAFLSRFPIIVSLLIIGAVNTGLGYYFDYLGIIQWALPIAIISMAVVFSVLMVLTGDSGHGNNIFSMLSNDDARCSLQIIRNNKLYMGLRLINKVKSEIIFSGSYFRVAAYQVTLLQLYGVLIQYRIFEYLHILSTTQSSNVELKDLKHDISATN